MKFLVKVFGETVQAGVVIFCMLDDSDVLYCGIANQSFLAYSSLHLSNFLPFHTLNNEFFVKDFCKTVKATVVIFGKQVDNDVLYRGIGNQSSPTHFSLYLSYVLPFHILENEIFSSKIAVKASKLE